MPPPLTRGKKNGILTDSKRHGWEEVARKTVQRERRRVRSPRHVPCEVVPEPRARTATFRPVVCAVFPRYGRTDFLSVSVPFWRNRVVPRFCVLILFGFGCIFLFIKKPRLFDGEIRAFASTRTPCGRTLADLQGVFCPVHARAKNGFN